jgi:hypothetical protein
VTSLIFVHGIGVRAPVAADGEHPYEATCRAISTELVENGIGWKLVKCAWGDDLGASLRAGGKSFPRPPGQLGVAARPADPAALWELLLDDPSFELRALAAMLVEMPAVAAGGPPGQAPPWVILQQRLRDNLAPAGQLAVQLGSFELGAAFAAAVKQTQADPAVAHAIRHPQAARAIARSIVARMVRIALDQGIPPPGLADLEALAGATEQLLRPAQLAAPLDWAKAALLGWGMRIGTSVGARQRALLAGAATPIAGDVILYQAHGDRIRARIHQTVAQAPEPVAILAHSLGGIASLEALCENAATRARVKKFITAGSQSGFFYEIDALKTLSYGQALPEDFPDWLNFYDQRDFLSFLTKDVFSGGGPRTDVEIKSGLPFPASHSGYWRQPLVWESVKAFLAD